MKKGIILTGSDSIAVAKQDDLVYRLEPIKQVVPIVVNNLTEFTPVWIDLSKQLKQDYRVVESLVDTTQDDQYDYSLGRQSGGTDSVGGWIREIENGKVVKTIYFNTSEGGRVHYGTYFDRNKIITLELSKTVDSITFFCEPIVLENPVVLIGTSVINAQPQTA